MFGSAIKYFIKMKISLSVACLFLLPFCLQSQSLILKDGWKIKTGDDMAWARPEYDDSGWKAIQPARVFETQGFEGYDGYAWYRLKFFLPSSLKEKSHLKESLNIFLGKIDDADITYLNGVEIGRTGRLDNDPKGYETEWQKDRNYTLPANHPALHWDADNVLAVRMDDANGGGGMWNGTPQVAFLDLIDYVRMDALTHAFELLPGRMTKTVLFSNTYNKPIKGIFTVKINQNGGIIPYSRELLTLEASSVFEKKIPLSDSLHGIVQITFAEQETGKQLRAAQEIPYILTPPEAPAPKINTPEVYGCRPGAPFQFYIAATGTTPMTYDASNLPMGLTLDKTTGIITGSIPEEGTYRVLLKVKNARGEVSKNFRIEAGRGIALTPPMGWNSWNCWGLSVSDAKVRASANAMVQSGLMRHGWTYINIDDGWEALERAADGAMVTNDKFPDMKDLSGYLHGLGLKLGIYSSPGPRTCGGFLGSYQHEQQDADSYKDWGIDYLKYDWCSYGSIAPQNPSLDDYKKPYFVMRYALANTGRDIVYSLCQYGMGNVWEWGHEVGGNVWRTTGDIEDTWESLKNIGFAQETPASFNGPWYGFGDPDMLVVGMVGWSDQLHQSRLTPSEQYTHITLWSLLSAPLMIGCDMSKMDAFTYNLLSNDEVIAIDQDPLGKPPKRVKNDENLQVWVKPLSDGSQAVGVFNMKAELQEIDLKWSDIGLKTPQIYRDLWRQKGKIAGQSIKLRLPAHGCALYKISG